MYSLLSHICFPGLSDIFATGLPLTSITLITICKGLIPQSLPSHVPIPKEGLIL